MVFARWEDLVGWLLSASDANPEAGQRGGPVAGIIVLLPGEEDPGPPRTGDGGGGLTGDATSLQEK